MDERKEIQKRKFYNTNDSGFAYLLANTIPLIFIFIITFILNAAHVDTKTLNDNIYYLIISAILSQFAFLLTAIFVNKTNKVEFSALKIKFNIKLSTILLCFAISIVCFFGMYNFIGVFDYVFDSIGYHSLATGLPLNTVGYLFLNILLLGIIPPICEEIVFRGIIFNGLRKSYSDKIAVVFSAFLFALMHGSLEQLVYPFLMGIVFATIVLRTGSIVPSMIVHMINNTLVIVFSYVYNMTGFSLGFNLNALTIILSILIALVGFVILYLIDKFYFKHKTHESMEITEKDGKKSNLLMIIGIAIAVLIFIINLISSFA